MNLLAAGYSKALTPAGVLLLVAILGGLEAGLGAGGSALLAVGIVGVPGFSYKKFPLLARTFGLPQQWRNNVVIALLLLAAGACALFNVPAPVPATVAGLAVGNAALAAARFRLNASAHVSVLTFGVLWVTAVFGSPFAILLILVPMMMLSRTALREHSWRECAAGAVIGILASGCFVAASGGVALFA